MKKVVILVNDVTTILQFRCELIRELVSLGHEVIVSVPESDRIKEIEDLGAKVVRTAVARHGKNPLKDIKLYRDYKKLVKEVKPDIVFTYTIKPNIYGGMACGKLKVPFVANVTGLGVAGDKGILQKLMLWLYKKGLKKAKSVFFQNKANLEFFTQKKIVKENTILLPGSGVNVERFSFEEFPKDQKPNLIFVGRIIKDKGVFELAEAIKSIDKDSVNLTVVGDVEYGSVNPFEGIENVKCVGFHKDVKPFLKEAFAIVLPSYHEGMANVLLEAAATGRGVIASNIPGCRETFDEGVSGFGFEVKNVESLTKALNNYLALTYEEKKNMGKAGREKMEKQFDRKIVVGEYVKQINSLENK